MAVIPVDKPPRKPMALLYSCAWELTLISVSIKINACLGLSEQQFVNESFIYPNPTKDKLTIQTNGDVDFVLINNLGEIVLETKILAGENSIDLSILETGVYFITLRREIFYKRFKVIKMQ